MQSFVEQTGLAGLVRSKTLGIKTLVQQFLLVGSALVLFALGVLGYWVSNKIENVVVADMTHRAAGYVQSVISQHLGPADLTVALPDQTIDMINRAIELDHSGLGITDFKVWSPSGSLLYDRDRTQIGHVTELSSGMRLALEGNVTSGFVDETHGATTSQSHGLSLPVVEIYVPIMETGTHRVIAIGEFYQSADLVFEELQTARRQTWIVTALVGLILITGLYGIVARGSRLIEQQRRDLNQRVTELGSLLQYNSELQKTSAQATLRSTNDHEAQLRRIGADLHDGVGQLITIVMLKLSDLFAKPNKRSPEFLEVKGLLDEAMKELRLTASGLGLPEIEQLSFHDAIDLIVSRHRKRTRTEVGVVHSGNVHNLSLPLKLCLCRVVQEALTNAFKHAGGKGQQVLTQASAGAVLIEVRDSGPGFKSVSQDSKRQKLGLLGLSNRLASLGGTLEVSHRSEGGTLVSARLEIGEAEGQSHG